MCSETLGKKPRSPVRITVLRVWIICASGDTVIIFIFSTSWECLPLETVETTLFYLIVPPSKNIFSMNYLFPFFSLYSLRFHSFYASETMHFKRLSQGSELIFMANTSSDACTDPRHGLFLFLYISSYLSCYPAMWDSHLYGLGRCNSSSV